MDISKLKLPFLFSLFLVLIQCQAKNPPIPTTGSSENFAELRELLKNSNSAKGNISFVAAAALSTPCVVHIKTKINVVINTVSPFHDFFGNEFFFQQPRNHKQESTGSGVIISKDGYIITNNHVINNASEIEVTLRNKNTYKAKVIGVDKDSDLALIKIEEDELPSIKIANSDSVMVGEWVLAVGNPFNLESTVTQGIVSAKGRSLNLNQQPGTNTAIESFIQTDAAVNPGNSGGALVNLNGELIGINTAIASPTGTYAGYAFAVPSNLVAKVIEDLKKYGNVQRAFLGIHAGKLTSERAKSLKLNSPTGVLIDGIVKGGAADAAGLSSGDVITKIDESTISSFPELLEHISTRQPGEKINVEYMRNGELKEIAVQLKNKNNGTEILKLDNNVYNRIGIEVVSLSPQERATYRVNAGVKVSKIKSGLIAQSSDMKPGFIILTVGDSHINSEDDLKSALQAKANGTIILEGFYPNRPFTFQYALKL